MVPKIPKSCSSDGNVCFKNSCSSIDCMGNVHVCLRHRNPVGFHVPRSRGLILVPVFSKHRRR